MAYAAHDSVRAKLSRLGIIERDARVRVAGHDQRRFADIIVAHVLYRVVERGRNRRHDACVYIFKIDSALAKKVVQHHSVFVRGARRLGGNSPRCDHLVAVKNTVLYVGVAYIHCENHIFSLRAIVRITRILTISIPNYLHIINKNL